MINNVLDKFNESIGYEKFLLEETLKIMSINSGENYRFGIVFSNHKYETHCMESSDSLSDNYKTEFIKDNLLPLIFTTSYKIIDMFIEYILGYNNFYIPWKFVEKIKFTQSEINNIRVPVAFENKEYKAIFEIYKSLVQNRNSLIHGRWGEVKNGKLMFNDGTNISTEQVIALANISYLITKVSNMDKSDIFFNSIKYTLHKNLNIVADLAKKKFNDFPENIVLYYEIKYKINVPDEKINMTEIRRYVNDDLEFWKRTDTIHKFEGVYNLFVIADNSIWKIPSSDIPDDLESIKVSDYMNYIFK